MVKRKDRFTEMIVLAGYILFACIVTLYEKTDFSVIDCSTFICIFCALFSCFIYSKNKEILKLEKRKIVVSDILLYTSLMVLINFTLIIIVAISDLILQQFGYTLLGSAITIGQKSTSISSFLYVCFLGPVFEEFLFRFAVIDSVAKKSNHQTGIIVSSILFGLYHGDFCQILPMIGVGLVLGSLYVRKSLSHCIVAHMLYNFTITEVVGRLMDAFTSDNAFVIIIETIFILSVLCIYINRKRISKFKITKADLISSKNVLSSYMYIIFIILALAEAILTIEAI